MSNLEKQITVLIAELEAYDRSLNFKMKGYEQEIMGEKYFACMVCGHCPKALVERLKLMSKQTPNKPSEDSK